MPYKGLDITGHVCLVTGGTSGLGRAVALGMAEAGAKVVAGSSSEGKVDAMRKELGKDHDALQVDIGSEASVQAAINHTVKRYGRIDSVVNAAGVTKRTPTLDVPLEEFERIVRINLTGSFIVARAAAQTMKTQTPDAHGHRGSIVLVASLTSYVAFSEVLAYSVSKTAVVGLIRGLANDWTSLGIRVNGIAPGVFPTDLNRHLIEGTPRGEWLKKHTPEGRFGAASEIAGAAIYLVSPAASFTNGHTLAVDGGFLARGV